MLTFYFAPGSSSMAVHIALHETGAPFEARPMSFATKDMQKPEFRAINPNGKVPTLLIDGRVLTEVAGCLFYLARTYPNTNLLPVNDPEAEAQVVSWMSFIASAIHPARQAGIERAREIWQIADQRLGRNDWAVGGRYSIADIHLFRLYWRIRDALEPKAGGFANIEAHYQRVMARSAVRKTIEIEEKIGYSLPR
jgi:glutathione S-transferase